MHVQKQHRKAPDHWRPTSSHLHRALGRSGLCSPAGSPPCVRQAGGPSLALTPPARLRRLLSEPRQPFPALQTPPLTPVLGGTPISSLPAQGTSSLSRAGSTRLCLQEKSLPERWREISKRVMLVRVTIQLLARKVTSDV